MDDTPAALLLWTGGALAAISGAAALVAAIALMNGAAGPRALAVFGWTVTLALIAGAGAGLGHLAWRMRRPRLAALTLTLAETGMFAWALALLGARPALLTFAPVFAVTALRALGRTAAVVTTIATLALYGGALALTVTGAWIPALTFPTEGSLALDSAVIVTGLALMALALVALESTSARQRARARAVERAYRRASADLQTLRAQTEDDADAIRQALSDALRGVAPRGLRARGALSPLAEQTGVVAERLVDLSYDREERKKLESATRRLIRNIERAWMGLSWSWPEASGVILDDLVALLRMPSPTQPTQLPEEAPPTGQLVAPHLYSAWVPGSSQPSQPSMPSMPALPVVPPLGAMPSMSSAMGYPSLPSIPSQPLQPSQPQLPLWPEGAGRSSPSSPSQPSGVWPALWPSEPEPAPGTDPLALPPSPRWHGPADPPANGSPTAGGRHADGR